MSRETPTLEAQKRDRIGSRYAQRLRTAGRLPAVIYGHKTDPVSVSVDETEFIDLLEHGAHLIDVKIDGAARETCLVKELQFGYLGDNVIHVDFARVDLDEMVSVQVHLHFVGEPEAGKRPGAIINHMLTDLEVECKASDIPEEIRLDLTGFESNVTVADVTLPPGVTTELAPSTPIVTVSFVHEEEPEGEAVEVEAGAEPEVITEGKKEESEES